MKHPDRLLGNTTIKVSTIKAVRYKLHRLITELLSRMGINMRVNNCMQVVTHPEGAYIKQASSGSAYYSGVGVCGSVWLCPICASRISEGRKDELHRALVANDKLVPVMVTITLQHHQGDKLKELLRQLNSSLKKLKAGRWWQEFKACYGVVAYVSSLEIRASKAFGWHPHKHILLFLKGEVDLNTLKGELTGRYTALLAGEGGYASEYHSIDVTAGDEGVASYIAKWGLLDELSAANMKDGKEGSYSPFQLAELSQGDKWAGRMFIEYARATFGIRQVSWSHRARQALGVEVASDKELSKDEGLPGDEVIAIIPKSYWKLIVRQALQGELLEVAEQSGADGVAEFLGGLSPPS